MSNAKPPASSPQKKRPFVVREIEAGMLRKHPELSRGARMLWLTMLSMANAKTGELRHRDHWYSGEEIDLRAELSHGTRKLFMKELAIAGLVRWERERIRRVIRDRLSGHLRMRCVSGRTKYTVSKSPHKDWVSHTSAQKSPRKHWGSSKVRSLYGTRIVPASLSVNHQEAGVAVSGSVFEGSSLPGSTGGSVSVPAVESDIGNGGEEQPSSSSVSEVHQETKSDDDDRARSPNPSGPATHANRIQRFRASALVTIRKNDHPASAKFLSRLLDYGDQFADLFILEWFDEFESRSTPRSANFYVTAFHNEISDLDDNAEAEAAKKESSPEVNAKAAEPRPFTKDSGEKNRRG